MFSQKPISILGILTITFILCLCAPWSAIAQFSEQRLIPVAIHDGEVETVAVKGFPVNAGTGGNTPTRYQNPILNAFAETLPKHGFMVYGRAPKGYPVAEATPFGDYINEGSSEAGILEHVPYGHIPNSFLDEPLSTRMPDLETFFDFGGTLELVTTDQSEEDNPLARGDIVISEIMWAVDRGLDNTVRDGILVDNPEFDRSLDATDETLPDTEAARGTNPRYILRRVPQLANQEVQWVEIYNTTDKPITAKLYFLFTPFVSHPTRDTVKFGEKTYKVLDAVDTLFTGLWKLPGKSGDRPNTAFVSTYRTIDYDTVENADLERAAQLAGIPFGANPNSWQATPENGRRNTDLKIIAGGAVLELLSISTPGAKHVGGIHVGRLEQAAVESDTIVINEVRNDTSRENVDWVELKNIGSGPQQLKDWELSIVTAAGKDTDLVDLPEYELDSGEILLLLRQEPWLTPVAGGINAADMDAESRDNASAYVVDSNLNLPNSGKFTLLLRSKADKNGKDEDIRDYAGNGFFEDLSNKVSTQFWPRIGQFKPAASSTAAFGDNAFASRNQAWKRKRYQENDGHHKDAWETVGPQAGIGYDPHADLSTSPGTPGYENDALKGNIDALVNGEVSISEIMYDRGPNGNSAQWIELYNSSPTAAVNLDGWELQIRNLHDDEGRYIDGSITLDGIALAPNQTFLIVSKRSGTNVPDSRIYDIYVNHRRDLNMTRSDLLLNPMGFYLKLTDTGNADLLGDDEVVDEVGNLTARGTRTPEWALPETTAERRRSIVRSYGELFTAEGADGESDPPEDGVESDSWRLFPTDGTTPNYYGNADDLANPGYRKGGPLPVTLAGFRPVRTENSEVIIKWRTEAEVNNAGFNILRSETRGGTFSVINVKGIIPGHGTSSEQHLYAYRDTTAKPNVIYYYRIEDVSFDGTRQTLATVRLKGDVSPAGKLTTTWSRLKARD